MGFGKSGRSSYEIELIMFLSSKKLVKPLPKITAMSGLTSFAFSRNILEEL